MPSARAQMLATLKVKESDWPTGYRVISAARPRATRRRLEDPSSGEEVRPISRATESRPSRSP